MPKISQLTELTTLQTGSIIPVVDGLVTKKVTMGTLVTFLNVETDVIPSGTVSSSTQLNSLGAVTTSSFNSYTSSLATTASNTFIGNQTITGSLNVTSSANLSGSIVINELTYPTADFADGQYGVEVPTLGVNNVFSMEIPKTVYEYVKNDSGGNLPKGTPVHSTGTTGFNTLVIAASASNAATMPATFILAQDLDDGEEGLGIAIGAIQGINTTGLVAGDAVYVGANGGFTQTKPTGSNLIQNLGIVTKVGNNGGGVVLGAGRSNDVPNIQEGYFWVGNSSSVATPTPTSSFVTTGSFNSFTSSVDNKNSVRLATTLELTNEDTSPPIYDNGDSGVGATLTFESTISVIDGVGGLQNGDRILIKDQSNQATNGIYVRTSGTVYTRAVDADTANKLTGGRFVFTQQGSSNGAKGFVFTHNGIPNIGVTALTVSQFTSGLTIETGSFATTGSNTFIGDQTITGSLKIQGIGGDEGGEIQLGLAQTNTTLSGSIVFDVYIDKLRLFEGGGNNRGAFLNVASQSNSVGSEIVTSTTVSKIETISSASYAALNPPVSGTLYIII